MLPSIANATLPTYEKMNAAVAQTQKLSRKSVFVRACFWSDCFQSSNTAVWIDEKRGAILSLCRLEDRRKVQSMGDFYRKLTIKAHGLVTPSRVVIASANKQKCKNTKRPSHFLFLAIWYFKDFE